MVFAYLSLERRFLSWFYATGGRGGRKRVAVFRALKF